MRRGRGPAVTPLVSVITPTWGADRHRVLLDRCIPSVRMQAFTDWEHLVVSDGPDPQLRVLGNLPRLRYLELPEHVEPHSWGASARNLGLEHTEATYVAYLDSDNAFRPEHLEVLVDALETSSADFAFSRLQVVGAQEIGSAPPAYGQIDTSLILHRRTAAERFGPWPVEHVHEVDWKFIARWIDQGATWTFVPKVTVDYYRS